MIVSVQQGSSASWPRGKDVAAACSWELYGASWEHGAENFLTMRSSRSRARPRDKELMMIRRLAEHLDALLPCPSTTRTEERDWSPRGC